MYHSQQNVKTNEENMVFFNTFFILGFLNIARVAIVSRNRNLNHERRHLINQWPSCSLPVQFLSMMLLKNKSYSAGIVWFSTVNKLSKWCKLYCQNPLVTIQAFSVTQMTIQAYGYEEQQEMPLTIALMKK